VRTITLSHSAADEIGETSVSNVNAIEFLERLGRDADLRYATRGQVDTALRAAGIEPAVRMAILNAESLQLEHLLGANKIVCCGVYAPETEREDEKRRKPVDDDKPTDKPLDAPTEKGQNKNAQGRTA
jgi:hypothetical protein